MDIERIINEYLRTAVDFIFPPLCLGCGSYTEHPYDICQNCLERIQVFKQPFCLNCFTFQESCIECAVCKQNGLLLFSFASYSPPLKDIIIEFKFKGITKTAKLFAEKIADQFGELIQSYQADCLIPVPLHASRQNMRGYNQADLFARQLASLLHIPINNDILSRTKKRKPQARLSLKERADNIKEVFALNESPESNKTCIIVDDVVTSGNTVLEAADTLRKGGHRVVAVLSIAHAL